ncbi:TonB-dependent receptor [Methylophilus medardicus]|uniref:TonB-dependent receptor n=1 Tax=Methylophilus medardicus TaxID=2588534 RepID=A0A5B8CU97_9PROT|nr:TonB-dependent receptor [Methylophilus medardicus]QDC49894.1 TonB-dependent receptor [Methylophilus medardicus]QDC53599.1 TonB-dependent receptor [Methylophilus medardicus]
MTLALMMALPVLAVAAEEEKTADAAQTMTEVKVKSTRIQDTPNKGYQATKTRVGKTYQDPQDVPQAVTTLTRELLHDQQVGSLREALRNVVGLSVNAAEGGRAGDNFNLRGFYTFGDIYLDNMRDTAQYNRETFNLEQVDVLRGSAAMLFGRGQAGGVINQVSKMAELRDKNTLTASGGEYDYHQFTGDFNKQLTETAAIRVNVMDRYEETYRKNPTTGDRPSFDRKGIAISFGAGIGTENEFFLNHAYTQTRDVPDFGIRFGTNKRPLSDSPNGRSDRTFWGSNNNFDDSDTRITTGIFTHKFDDDTQLRTQLRHANYKRSYWAKTPGTTLPLDNDRLGGNVTRIMDYETLNLQSDFSTKFELAGMKHQLISGIEYLKEDSYRSTLQPYDPVTGALYTQTGNALTNAILANPNGVAYNRHFANVTATPTKFNADNYALYIQDSVEVIKNWTVLAGIRRDKMDADYSSLTSPKLKYYENSYRTGLSWQPNADRHYYLTFSDAFSPTADLYQLTVQPLPPERARTLELGTKWLFLDGDLSVRTAVFTTTKDWERNTDLESTASILTKRRRTNGVEFEVTGKITDRWDMFAGFALLDARIINVADNYVAGVLTPSDVRLEGQRARNTPIGTFNLWTTYALNEAWKVGGGVEAKGERYAYNPSATDASASFTNGHFNPNAAPGYARVDMMAAYEQPKWAVRLNVKNLLNKEYYDAVYDNGGLVTPGNKRQAIITTEYKF